MYGIRICADLPLSSTWPPERDAKIIFFISQRGGKGVEDFLANLPRGWEEFMVDIYAFTRGSIAGKSSFMNSIRGGGHF